VRFIHKLPTIMLNPQDFKQNSLSRHNQVIQIPGANHLLALVVINIIQK